MLSRRAFLERGSLALAAMSLHTARAADAQVGPLGKPIGLQLYGRPFDERTMLRVAHAYQLVTDWHLRRPEPQIHLSRAS